MSDLKVQEIRTNKIIRMDSSDNKNVSMLIQENHMVNFPSQPAVFAWYAEFEGLRFINYDPFNIPTGEEQIIGEYGNIVIENTSGVSAGFDWYPITFTNTYNDPVVIPSDLTLNGTDPATIRVRNLTSTGCEFSIQEPANVTTGHGLETLSYLVLESGEWTSPQYGLKIKCGKLNMGNGTVPSQGSVPFQTVNYTNSFPSTSEVLLSSLLPFKGFPSPSFPSSNWRQSLPPGGVASPNAAAAWTQFMKDYAVYPLPPGATGSYVDQYVGQTLTIFYNIKLPVDGDYILKASADNAGTVQLDSLSPLVASSFSLLPAQVTLSNLTAGNHTVTATVNNLPSPAGNQWQTNPAGIAWTLEPSNIPSNRQAVLTSMQTTNGPDWAITRTQDTTNQGFKVAIQEALGLSPFTGQPGGPTLNTGGHNEEVVGWVAFESGIIDESNGQIISLPSDPKNLGTPNPLSQTGSPVEETQVDDSGQLHTYVEPFPGSIVSPSFIFPTLILKLSSFYGTNPANLRKISSTGQDYQIFVQEETTYDPINPHSNEYWSALTFEGQSGTILGNPNSPQIPFNVKVIDEKNNFDSEGTFVVPVDGIYMVSFGTIITSATNIDPEITAYLIKNGIQYKDPVTFFAPNSSGATPILYTQTENGPWFNCSNTWAVECFANDVLNIWIKTDNGAIFGNEHAFISIWHIG